MAVATGSQSPAGSLPPMIRTLGRVLTVVAALASASTVFAACGDDDDNEAEASLDATIEMAEYSYDVSGEIPRGGTIRLMNSGDEFHMLGVGKLKGGKTYEEALEALKSESEDDDAGVYDQISMPGAFMGPGEQADISVASLDAGHYVIACFVNVEGKETPHFLRGMTGEVTVTKESAE